MDIQKFLTRLKNQEISHLEVRNFTEEITNNYELGKLRLLHYEMESFFYHTKFTPKEAEYFSKHIVFLAKKIKRVEHESFFKKLIEKPGFDTFIEEMQTLKMNVSFKVQRDRFRRDGKERCYLDLSHYSQDDRAYRNHLGRVQQVALTEVSNLNDEQIKRQLKRLNNVQKRLVDSIHFYRESHKEFDNGNLDQSEFKYRLANQFIFEAPEFYEHGIITNEFMFHLHDAIAFKAGCISSFIEQIHSINTKEEPNLFAFDTEENKQIIDLISDYVFSIPHDTISNKANLGDGVFLSNKNEILKRLLIKCCSLLASVLEGQISFKKAKTKIRSLIYRIINDSKNSYFEEHLTDTLDLLELELNSNLNRKESIENIDKLSELAKQYCNNPHSLYKKNEVLYILKKAEEFKHQNNVSALIRNIQNDNHCPESIKDKGKFKHSNKHVKRQRKVIDFYDKETGNKRK